MTNELKKELLTREVFEERFKSLNFKLNVLLAIALAALTFANSTFVSAIEKLF